MHNTKMAGRVSQTQSDADQSPKSSPIHTPVMLPPCRICNEKASGFHYGVNTCEACKGFFRRSLSKKVDYKCLNDGKCGTQYSKRNMCAACRYKKCIEVGMSKSAINKGRYTHEKKNNNIKEVKQLEQEQRAAQELSDRVVTSSESPVTSSEAVVALFSEQRLAAEENKFEKVIEDILAAFQGYALYGVNLFTSVKENQETFLKEKQLYTDMFGSLKPVTKEEYIKIFHSTGLDIDGRRQLIERIIPLFEIDMRHCISFIRELPGFVDLPLEDQISLFKISRREMHIILSHKAFNHERRLVTFAWGDTLDFDSLSKMHSGDLMEAMFAVSRRIQKLDLGRTETVVLSCIALFFADRCQLTCPEKVEDIQHLMIQTLSYLLKKSHADNSLCLAQCLLIFPVLRSLEPWFREEHEIFKLMWNDKIVFPPLFYELCDHY